MSSDEDAVVAYYYVYRKKKKHRTCWIKPYISNNINRGAFVCAKELQHDEEKLKLFYQISKES